MVSITMTARGFGNNTSMLNELTGELDDTIAKLFHKMGEDIVADARHTIQQNQNINKGDLLASIQIRDEVPGKEMSVGSDKEHAQYIEFGRGPIFAKDKPLHWIDKTTGEDRFAMRVKEVEPMPFLEPSVIKHTRKFKDVMIEEQEEFVNSRISGFLDEELL